MTESRFDPYGLARPEDILDGGPCYRCKHGDAQHHTTALPRWCGECRCRAYIPTSAEYHHALIVIRRMATYRTEVRTGSTDAQPRDPAIIRGES